MSETEPFDVVVDSGITFAVFRPSYAQIDELHVDLANRKMIDLVSGLKEPRLVLDMTHVNFFGSSFIEAMFRVYKRLQSRENAKFALCGVNPYCREVLEVTHLDSLWPLCANRADAVAKLTTA